MIFDHRTYTLPHGTVETYLERYERMALPAQLRHLGNLVGFYTSLIGPLCQVVHIWGYASLADMEKRRAALAEDPQWQAFLRENKGSFVQQETKILQSVPFSPTRWEAPAEHQG